MKQQPRTIAFSEICQRFQIQVVTPILFRPVDSPAGSLPPAVPRQEIELRRSSSVIYQNINISDQVDHTGSSRVGIGTPARAKAGAILGGTDTPFKNRRI
jgi:hypothetical protein